ncbi:unnamed protein product [Microthlaspi erraticum]|uniref:Uncharacterized protein n=1 Tax=Microthlaspi erraticum TaxID=1685480 RepID=A0A6D2K483_9BRAS|nr:unnamed protein product [Microthlaspi erraticum]
MRPKTSSLGRNSHVYLVYICFSLLSVCFSWLSLAETGYWGETPIRSRHQLDRAKEEPPARSRCMEMVEWSAPDGRLPSPDHDLASQFFGEH